jgi:tetratricopeptide (TPR) repeat protein
MFAGHPSKEDLASFLRGAPLAGKKPPTAQVMRHLLSDCAVCRNHLTLMGWSRERLARLVQPPTEGAASEAILRPAHDYSTAFAAAERSVSAFLAPEPSAAEIPASRLWQELEALEPEERVKRVGAGAPFATPSLVRLLVDRSHALRYKDASEMLHFADLARTAAEGCSPGQAGDEMRLWDLRAKAWGQLSSALRVCNRAREAEKALATAREYRERGTGDPMLRAWMLERVSSLLLFQGQFSAAIESYEEAGQIYEDLGEDNRLAGIMIYKAVCFIYSGETERAVRILNQAIPLIDPEEDPHLLLAACHNLVWCYVDLDRPDQALTLYNETRELYQEFDDPLILLRATWQEGRLLRDLGHLRAAETALLRSRKGFLEAKLAHEAALVSLDLAAVYVKLGLVDEVKRTVTATVPIFHALRVKLETLAALLQLQKMADQEQQALELIRTLHALVEPLRRQVPAEH